MITEKEIIETLFSFIKDHFDDFNHQPRGNDKWWLSTQYGHSWAPFVEACFILEGEKRCYGEVNNKIGEIGHSYTHPNITNVFQKMLKNPEPYNSQTRYLDFDLIDLSWRDKNDKLILALEHSEDGSKTDNQLKEIFREMDKLNGNSSDFNVIVSRPRLRRLPGHRDQYSDRLIEYENRIKEKLSEMQSKENWIFILIAPESDFIPVNTSKKIIFHCYKWENDKLSKIVSEIGEDYSFEVIQNDEGKIIKKQ
jgi:hypothetical protein